MLHIHTIQYSLPNEELKTLWCVFASEIEFLYMKIKIKMKLFSFFFRFMTFSYTQNSVFHSKYTKKKWFSCFPLCFFFCFSTHPFYRFLFGIPKNFIHWLIYNHTHNFPSFCSNIEFRKETLMYYIFLELVLACQFARK